MLFIYEILVRIEFIEENFLPLRESIIQSIRTGMNYYFMVRGENVTLVRELVYGRLKRGNELFGGNKEHHRLENLLVHRKGSKVEV